MVKDNLIITSLMVKHRFIQILGSKPTLIN